MEQAEVAQSSSFPKAEKLAHLPLVTLDQQSAQLVRHGESIPSVKKPALQRVRLARRTTTDRRSLAIIPNISVEDHTGNGYMF